MLAPGKVAEVGFLMLKEKLFLRPKLTDSYYSFKPIGLRIQCTDIAEK